MVNFPVCVEFVGKINKGVINISPLFDTGLGSALRLSSSSVTLSSRCLRCLLCIEASDPLRLSGQDVFLLGEISGCKSGSTEMQQITKIILGALKKHCNFMHNIDVIRIKYNQFKVYLPLPEASIDFQKENISGNGLDDLLTLL